MGFSVSTLILHALQGTVFTGVACRLGVRHTAGMARPLTVRQQRFIGYYVRDFNGTRSAIAAGYSRRSAPQIASRLLHRDKVVRGIKRAVSERAERVKVSADDVLRELGRIGMSTPAGLVDDEGRLKNVVDLSPDAAASIASFEIATDPDSGTAKLSKVRLADKVSALSTMTKLLGMQSPTTHLHAVVSLTPDQLSKCSDEQLARVESASLELSTIQAELSGSEGVKNDTAHAPASLKKG